MSFVTRLNQKKKELFAGRKVELDGCTFWANKSVDEIWMKSPHFDDMCWYADVSDDGEIVKNEFTIYWIHEGSEHEGLARYEACDGYDAYIAFSTWQNESKTASEIFDRIDADDLEGGEDALRELWDDLLSAAEASGEFRLDVTYTDLI